MRALARKRGSEEAHAVMHAILIDSSNIGGAERRALNIFRGFQSRGHDIGLFVSGRLFKLVSDTYPEFSKNMIIYDDYEYWSRHFEKGRRFPYVREAVGLAAVERHVKARHLNRLFSRYGVDLVHIFLERFAGAGVSVRKVYELTSPDYVDIVRAFPRSYLEEIDAFTAVSGSVGARAAAFLPSDRLHEAPIAYFDADSTPDWSPADKTDLVTFAHRFLPRKNGLLFARACVRFLERNPGWSVAMHGRGPEESAIAETLAPFIAAGRVSFGHRRDLSDTLKATRVFVSLIEPDNYPSQSVLEAMSCGAAILVSDTGESAARFVDGNGAVTALTVEDVCARLEALIADRGALDAMGARSARIVRERYDKGVYLDYLGDLYGRVAAAPPRAAGRSA